MLCSVYNQDKPKPQNYINPAKITHILVDVKECCPDSMLDSSQIWLVPVDVEHPSHIVAAGVVTGHILQQEGLLTTGRWREKEREGKCMLSFAP